MRAPDTGSGTRLRQAVLALATKELGSPKQASRGREHSKSWGADGVGLGSRLTGRGWAGAETGVAGEAGCGAAAWGDDGDRGRLSRARRGGWPGRPRAEAQRGEAAHGGAP